MALLTRQPSIGSLRGINPDVNSTIDESDPLLLSHRVIPSSSSGRKRCCRCSRKQIRNIITLLTIWIAYLLISAAYSIIAPFYPQEVGIVFLIHVLCSFHVYVQFKSWYKTFHGLLCPHTTLL